MTEHFPGDGEQLGVQGAPVLAVQVRGSEADASVNARTHQADLAVGAEPPIAEDVRGDGEPVGG
jgi:hypothetical protein